jgi:uncharacterized protein YdiU (UPF0061 family)
MRLYDRFDEIEKPNSFAALPPVFYTRWPTTPLNEPSLLHVNQDAAALLGLSTEALIDPSFLDVVSGNAEMPGGQTLAAVYSGHQFGHWAGQLGDGRAHLLGEIKGPAGNWELQLKGAGMTPYSRMGDGRAVLRSSVREYLASHAMHGLGIPTTRALSLVSAKNPVMRETVETAAVVARMAPSFIRFGSFQHWAAQQKPDYLRQLADYVIERYYPECLTATNPYVSLLEAVVKRTAELMAGWQVVGFCHGVMNTDNMSILGLTLDYGPYGFMDEFDAGHICNHTDTNGRYAWHAQPSVAHWNLYQLANSLHTIVPDADALRAALDHFDPVFLSAMQQRMMQKLGLSDWQEGDEIETDLGNTVNANLKPFVDLFINREAAELWLERYRQRIARNPAKPEFNRIQTMLAANPLYVLRNHLAQQAIEAAQRGDASEIDRLMQVLKNPFVAQPGMEAYAAIPPAWLSHIEVSCSS